MVEQTRIVRRRKIPRGLVFPILLIIIGFVILLDNLGRLPEGAASTLLRLWPLIFILGGLENLVRGEDMAMATFGVSFGVIFLLNNFGMLPWNAWDMLFRLWPLFIVAIGLDLLLGKRSMWLGLLGAVIILLLGAGLWSITAPRTAVGMTAVNSETISQPVGSAERARIYLNPAVASLKLQALENSKDLLAGHVKPLKGERIVQNPYSVENGQGFVWLRSMGEMMWVGSQNIDTTWDLGASPDVPIDLEISMAVGEMTADLTGMQIENVRMSLAVGKGTLILPEDSSFEAKLDLAIGQFEIQVPEGLGVKVKYNGGLSGFTAPDGWIKDGNTYTSPGYSAAKNKVSIEVSTAIGGVVVKMK
jgi:hypothetical protein